MFRDHLVQLRVFFLIWQLCTNDQVILLWTCELVLSFHYQQEVCMRQSPLLELYYIYVGLHLTKYVFLHQHFSHCIQLCSEDPCDEIWAVMWCLAWVKFILDISSQLGLHVIVRKISGLPYFRTRAIASMYQRLMSQGPAMNDEDNTVRCPTFSADPSPECMLSTRPWYRLAINVS